MAFFALIIYTILIYIRPQEIFPELYEVPIIEMTAVTTLFLAIFTNKLKIRKLFDSPRNQFILLFLISLSVSHLSHLYFHGALNALMEFGKILVLYFLITALVDTPVKLKTYVVILVFLTFLLAVQGIQQYYTGAGWGGQSPLIEKMDPERDAHAGTGSGGEAREVVRIRGLGFFADPNDLALALIIVVPFLISFTFGNSFILLKTLALSILFSIVYAIYLTNSRGGYLAFAAVLYMFCFIRLKGFKAALAGALAVLAVLVYAPSRLGASMNIDESSYGRIDAWTEGMKMFKSSPLFGVGMGMFTDYNNLTAHNSFLLVLAETGLLGVFFWSALFYVTIRDHLRVERLAQWRDTDRLRGISRSLLIGLVGFLSAAFFLSRAYIPLPYMIIALSTSTLKLIQRENGGLRLKFQLRDVRNISLTVGAGIALIHFMLGFLWSMAK